MEQHRVFKVTAHDVGHRMVFRYAVVAVSVADAETKVMEHVRKHHKRFGIHEARAESEYETVWI